MATETIDVALNEDGSYAEEVSLRSGDRVERVTETRVGDDGTEFEKTVAIRITREVPEP